MSQQTVPPFAEDTRFVHFTTHQLSLHSEQTDAGKSTKRLFIIKSAGGNDNAVNTNQQVLTKSRAAAVLCICHSDSQGEKIKS